MSRFAVPDITNGPRATYWDRGRQVYNVYHLDFMAYGDNAHDDHDAIQAALDRASADGGGVVVCPAGTYRMQAPLLMPQHVVLQGAGMSATVLNFIGNISGITRSGTAQHNSGVLRDLTIQGPGVSTNTSGVGVDLTRCWFWRLQNVRITGFWTGWLVDAVDFAGSVGAYYNAAHECRVDNCTIGVNFDRSANENHMIGGRISSCATGVSVGKGSASNKTDNCTFSHVGIEVISSKGCDIGLTFGITFLKCRLESAGALTLATTSEVTVFAFCDISGSTTLSYAGAPGTQFIGNIVPSTVGSMHQVTGWDNSTTPLWRGRGKDDTGWRLQIAPDCILYFGDGTNAPDTTLRRSSANLLRTDDAFLADDGLATRVFTAAPVDGDFAWTPINGTIVVDNTNSRIYVRIGGAWKYAALT